MTPVEVLKKAKALIEERGWHQGWYTNGRALCARGACLAAVGFDFPPDSARFTYDPHHEEADTAQRFLARAVGAQSLSGLGSWNDKKARSVEEVLSAFDLAIVFAEQETSS
jgi:hypothetical protein